MLKYLAHVQKIMKCNKGLILYRAFIFYLIS